MARASVRYSPAAESTARECATAPTTARAASSTAFRTKTKARRLWRDLTTSSLWRSGRGLRGLQASDERPRWRRPLRRGGRRGRVPGPRRGAAGGTSPRRTVRSRAVVRAPVLRAVACASVTVGARGRAVVGPVEAAPLQDDAHGPEDLAEGAPARRADLEGGVGEGLDGLEPSPAGRARILIGRHAPSRSG